MGIFLYNLFLLLYKVSASIIAPFNPKVRLWLAGRRNWPSTWVAKLDKAGIHSKSTVVWMHASSLGEFEQGRPVIEAIRSEWPDMKIVVTFFSPSGYEVRKNYSGADVVGYLPFDHPLQSARFVEQLHPSLVLWVKYEYWYHSLKAINKRKVPLLLVSGIFRKDQPFFKAWGSLHRKMIGFFTQYFVQTQNSFDLLKKIAPVEKMQLAGDTRYDSVIATANKWQPIPLIENWLSASEKVIVAGSTWPSDEEEIVHYTRIHKEVKWIIAPHNTDEQVLEETLQLFEQFVLYSQLKQNPEAGNGKNVLIIDNVGMLRFLYKYATICYIGGGFTGDGVHNVLEAAVYGRPVIHGPEYTKYPEAEGLVNCGASFVIDSGLELEALLDGLFAKREGINEAGEAAADYVQNHRGATNAVMNYIQEKRLLTSATNF